MAVLVDGHLNPDRLDLIQAQREIEPLLKIYRRLRKAHPFDGSLDIIRAFIAVLSKKFNVDGFPHPHGVHKSPIQIKKHRLFIFQKIRGFPCKYKVFVELKFLFIFLITFQE